MGAGKVVVVDVGDVVRLSRVRPYRSYHGAPGLVTVDVGDVHVAAVSFHANAVLWGAVSSGVSSVLGVPLIDVIFVQEVG